MYERDVSGGAVGWEPEYPEIAARVMADHSEVPHDSPEKCKSEAPCKLDSDCCRDINQEYRKRVEADPDKSMGGGSM
jgi:hypothetical protein